MRNDDSSPNPLDIPIWYALTTCQSSLAEGAGLARRYPAAIGPMSGTLDQSTASYEALRTLLSPEEVAALFLEVIPHLPTGLAITREVPLVQMVWKGAVALPPKQDRIQALNTADVDEMLTLTELTKPGPFGPRTHELGTYLGIRTNGQLVAMAGERLHLPGFTEISAVCTHPDHRGHGYAGSLISTLIGQITTRGEVPFLHAAKENVGAIRVYEHLGFEIRRFLTVVVLRRDS